MSVSQQRRDSTASPDGLRHNHGTPQKPEPLFLIVGLLILSAAAPVAARERHIPC